MTTADKIFEKWRKFLKEEKTNLSEEEVGGLKTRRYRDGLDPEPDMAIDPEDPAAPDEEQKRLSPLMPDIPKGSIVIGNLRGTGKSPKYKRKTVVNDDGTKTVKKVKVRNPLPYGLFINGEYLGEDPRWDLGANMQGNRKKNHYGTNELIKTLKAGIENVHRHSQEEYDIWWLRYILGSSPSGISDQEEDLIKMLKSEKIIPAATLPLYIEDLGLGPFKTDIYGNTYHGGHKVPNHGSHQTGQDGDIAFYMMPGYEMKSVIAPVDNKGKKKTKDVDHHGFRIASGPRNLGKGFITFQELEFINKAKSNLDVTSSKELKTAEEMLTGLKNMLGTFDPIRTWKLVSGMSNPGYLQMALFDKTLIKACKRAAEICGEKSKIPKAVMRHQDKHKNHIHFRVNAPDSIKRGKKLNYQLMKKFKSVSSTKRFLMRYLRQNPTTGEKLYPNRLGQQHWEDILTNLDLKPNQPNQNIASPKKRK